MILQEQLIANGVRPPPSVSTLHRLAIALTAVTVFRLAVRVTLQAQIQAVSFHLIPVPPL